MFIFEQRNLDLQHDCKLNELLLGFISSFTVCFLVHYKLYEFIKIIAKIFDIANCKDLVAPLHTALGPNLFIVLICWFGHTLFIYSLCLCNKINAHGYYLFWLLFII